MAEHLPGCTLPTGHGDCICGELRQAEWRGYENGCIHSAAKYPDIYSDGVKAAREAVAALAPTWAVKFYVNRPSNGEWIGCNGAHEEVDVLAAIDVLQPRGDNSA